MLVCVGVGVSGCGSTDGAASQRVVGKVAYIGEPPASRKVKLVSPDETGCGAPGELVSTDPSGAFALTRIVVDAASADAQQTDLLCIETAQGWVPVWQDTYGPTPTTLDIFCAGTVGAWKCEVFGDGVSLAKSSK